MCSPGYLHGAQLGPKRDLVKDGHGLWDKTCKDSVNLEQPLTFLWPCGESLPDIDKKPIKRKTEFRVRVCTIIWNAAEGSSTPGFPLCVNQLTPFVALACLSWGYVISNKMKVP